MTASVFHRGAASDAVQEFVPTLVQNKIASRLFAKDNTLWGKAAEKEAAVRLGWVTAASESLALIPELRKLKNDLVAKGLNRVVLCGMGGSSLAPEVICNTYGVDLVVLDSTDPSQVHDAISESIETTIVVVSSKSGSTVETDSQKRSFESAFESAGIDKTERIFVVTDPDSPMHKQALADGYRVFLGDPFVGGRYSALTAFGVVPSVLAGVDMQPVLESAIQIGVELAIDSEKNPGLVLGAAIAKTKSSNGFRNKLGFVPEGSPIVGFGDWVEQLIAESTGKDGRGLLPIVLSETSPELSAAQNDVLLIGLARTAEDSTLELSVSGDLGELILLWEFATVVASIFLQVNPFDQPDVESAKIAARSLLESSSSKAIYNLEDDGIEVAALGFEVSDQTLASCLDNLLSLAQPESYFSIQAYLNRQRFKDLTRLRDLIAKKTNRPTTFGWGPRFLHSTGQFHKGGPKEGIFLQIVAGADDDLSIPGRKFGYRELISSQASGDAKVLADHGLPVLVLRVREPALAIKRLIGLLV